MADTYKNRKNGLIELLRFICSVWVVYYHGFFPILSDKFDGVNVSVDLFFIISGFYFLRSIEKYRESPFHEGVCFITWGRIRKFVVPFAIAAASILLCNITIELDWGGFNWPLSFLWFFAVQFGCLTLYYLLLKLIRRRFVFNIICGIIICIFMSMFKLGIFALNIPFRGPAMLALGMLISQIPKIRTESDNKKAQGLCLALNVVGFALSFIGFIYLAYLPGFYIWKLHLLCLIVCPSLVYFATAIPVYSKLLNLLGEFSIYIYLAQCPILFHYYLVNKDSKAQFLPLCVCILIMFALNRFVNRKRVKAR